jgi:hypothetical protein
MMAMHDGERHGICNQGDERAMASEEEASLKLQDLPPDASDQEVIAAAADYLIAQGPYHGGKWHLSVIDVDKPVEHDWHWKNVWGITTKDAERARAWISECMRLGYGVFGSSRKHGTGGGLGSITQIRERSARTSERHSQHTQGTW